MTKHMKTLTLGSMIAVAALAAPTTPLMGQSAQERGLEVATEADRRDTGFGDSTAEMVMTLRNSAGQESVREIRNKTLEVDGDGDKSLVNFDQPRDVAGTAF
jgi:hypothetical protein